MNQIHEQLFKAGEESMRRKIQDMLKQKQRDLEFHEKYAEVDISYELNALTDIEKALIQL